MAARGSSTNPRIMSAKQLQAIAMIASGDVPQREMLKDLGINSTVLTKWQANEYFMDKVYEMQATVAAQALGDIQKKVTVKKRTPGKIDPQVRARALIDFNYFRREFLGRKRVVCQGRWGRWFEEEDRSVLLCPRGHGKSTTVVDYVVWKIIQDRTIRVLVLSKNSKLAKRWIYAITAMLEGRGRYRKIVQYFGAFKPDVPEKWTQEELIVEGASVEEPHPTLSCFGITAAIYGLRADLILCDDIVDTQNAGTEEQRDKLRDVFFSAIENILDAVDGRKPKMFVIGTRKHPLDLYNDLLSTPEFKVHIENAVQDWSKGRILAPELFDIEFFRKKLAILKVKKFNREFQNASFDERDVIINSDAFDNMGNLDELRSYGHRFDNWYVILNVDPGTSLKTKNTFAISVTAIDPEDENRRFLIDWNDEFVPSEDQPRFICAWYHKYGASAVRIESNACQKYLMDSVQREALAGGVYGGVVWTRFLPNVHPHFTSHTKLNDPVAGLETIGHHFEMGNWSLPYATEADITKTHEFIDKLVGYTYREHRKAHHAMCLWFGENEALERLHKELNIILLPTPAHRYQEPQFIDIRG